MSDDLPPNWVCLASKSRNGKKYFFNTQTGVSTWKNPTPLQNSTEAGGKEPSSKSGRKRSRKRKNNTNINNVVCAHSKKQILASDIAESLYQEGIPLKNANGHTDTSVASSGSASCDKSSLTVRKSLVNKKAQSGIKPNREKTLSAQAPQNRCVLTACRKTKEKDMESQSKKTNPAEKNSSESGKSNVQSQIHTNTQDSKSVLSLKSIPSDSLACAPKESPMADRNKASHSKPVGKKASNSKPVVTKASHTKPIGTLSDSHNQVTIPVKHQKKSPKSMSAQVSNLKGPSQVPLISNKTKSSDSQSKSQVKTHTKRSSSSSHHIPVTSGSIELISTNFHVNSTSNKAIQSNTPPAHAPLKDQFHGGGQSMLHSNNEDKVKATGQMQCCTSKDTFSHNTSAKTRSTESHSRKAKKYPSKNIFYEPETFTSCHKPVNHTEKIGTLIANNTSPTSLIHNVPKGINTNQTPLNVTKANQIPEHTSQPSTNVFKADHIQTDTAIHGNLFISQESPSVSLVNKRQQFGPNSTDLGLSLFQTDDQNHHQSVNNSDSSDSNSFFFQGLEISKLDCNLCLYLIDADHDSVDLGSTVVESTRIIEDMDVDSDGADESIHVG
ncbi:hypothetical protein ElyMa_004027700 [Elysia marginata]|uniref:WW domain-containing protein n=1 Tax=Elysia marginata TaxID=1093978 RepID=A0AAV4G2G7_9GAST|nr:hypothetical protein ElyMa_004027700 [Elysia marginata]